jgi:integrase
MLGRAVKKGLIGRNPLDAVEKPRIQNPKKKVNIDSDKVQRILIGAETSCFRTLYYLAIVTGMREGELIGLRWLDIDWRKNTLKVVQQAQHVSGQGMVFGSPKTEAGRRTLALGQATINKLIDHRVSQEEERRIKTNI